MRERPILMSGPMVRAVLEGRKTQTRRVVKVPGIDFIGGLGDSTSDPRNYGYECPETGEWWILGEEKPYNTIPGPCAAGDTLWVREAFRKWREGSDRILYRADKAASMGMDEYSDRHKWKPSIHMPRSICRLFLTVTSVRCERLQDISEDDAKAEGLKSISKDQGRTWKWGIPDRDGWPGTDDDGWPWTSWHREPRTAFRNLWDRLNKVRWAQNPWVWAITFERQHQ